MSGNPNDAVVVAALRAKIQHVIYLITENRTFDQVLGDLQNGSNGHPYLTMVFDLSQTAFSYTATASSLLYSTGLVLLLPPATKAATKSTHDAAWWAARTKGYDWSSEDRIPTGEYDRTRCEGLNGGDTYPGRRNSRR